MRLVSDFGKFHLNINGVDIAVSPKRVAPFDVAAVVEEQDVALILNPDQEIEHQEIRDPGDKPLWYLSHKLESQATHKPGSIFICYETPLRLLAIVHDFDHEPSWRSSWIAQALENLFDIADEKDISSLKLPVLGAQYGRFSLDEFLSLLVTALNKASWRTLKRIWLVVPAEDCRRVFDKLESEK